MSDLNSSLIPGTWSKPAAPDASKEPNARFDTQHRDYVDRFYSLLRQWEAETVASGLVRDRVEHPAFRAIVGMGLPSVPLILDEIQIKPSYLVLALKEILDRDPVPASAAGRIGEIVNYWLIEALSSVDIDYEPITDVPR